MKPLDPEEYDKAVLTVKAFGCTCRPTVTRWHVEGFRLTIVLKHSPTCRYDPAKVFEPDQEFDQEAHDKRAKALKKRRQKAARK